MSRQFLDLPADTRLGFRQTNITYKKRERKTGGSVNGPCRRRSSCLSIHLLRSPYAPIRFVTIVGISFLIIGFLWALYIIIRKLVFDDLAAGWPITAVGADDRVRGDQYFLGIIAEYLWRTLDASRRRQVFIIDEIKELN